MGTDLNLAFHRQCKKNYEIHDQNRPEDRYVENIKECTDHGNNYSFGKRIPEKEQENIIYKS